MTFERIAIVNRGEPAMRLIRAVGEFNHERGTQLRTIALHTAAEHNAMFVRCADEAVCLSVPPRSQQPRAASLYLDYEVLEAGLRAARADAAWVGWGFVAEHPQFAELCESMGIVFIGPPADVMRRLGDKIEAKRLAEEAGVPVAAWSGGAVPTIEQARQHGATIGYPLMIKATAGGGGRGIRLVEAPDQLEQAFDRARAEAEKSFGDATVFMERVVTDARHVEVQIIADHHGTAWAVGVRDCSVQRRNQKVIEESRSTVLDAAAERLLRDSSERLASMAGYRNTGTVEFLYRPTDGTLAFLEVNTRLQVEHPVTELTTGLDLVKLQILMAMGEPLVGEPPESFGYAIEARLNAEDPDNGFAPAPGKIEMLSLASGPGVRIDTGVAAGDVMPSEYDSMIAKIIAWGTDRNEAQARLRRALAESSVVIEGGTTNRTFLLSLLAHPDYQAGTITTSWLDRLGDSWRSASTGAPIALLLAVVEVLRETTRAERARFLATAARGRPHVSHDPTTVMNLRHEGNRYRIGASEVGPDRFRATIDDVVVVFEVHRLSQFTRRVVVGTTTVRAQVAAHGSDYLIEVEGSSHRISKGDAGLVVAPSPALVVAITVKPDDLVEMGAPVIVLESMKIESWVSSPVSGRVLEVYVSANVQVDAGAPLLRIEAQSEEERPAAGGARLRFDGFPKRSDELAHLHWAFLGYDSDPGETRVLARGGLRVPGVLAALRAFADVSTLSRNRRLDGDGESDETHTPKEYFHAYLRSLHAEAEGLPPRFLDKLLHLLAHYGVTNLDHTEQLEVALFRAYQAQQRASSQTATVVALLDHLLEPDAVSSDDRAAVLDTLDQLISATQLRYPVVGSAARAVRFRLFDGPLLVAARDEEHQRVLHHLRELTVHPEAADAEARKAQVVASPQPLLGLLGEANRTSTVARNALLEILTRRYYKLFALHDFRHTHSRTRPYLTAEYAVADSRVLVIVTHASISEASLAIEDLAHYVSELNGETPSVVDLYLFDPHTKPEDDSAVEQLLQCLDTVSMPSSVLRIAVTQYGGSGEPRQFTVRPRDGRFREDRPLRGLHPMIATRLHMWRLDNFDLTRLPSAHDVHLFHCIARKNPADERLVAVAEVRDITPLRDERGAISALPELEHVLSACLDSIRHALDGRRTRRPMEWNRVLLHVWPELDLTATDAAKLVRDLAPLTENLGLEQVMVQARFAAGGASSEQVLRMSKPPGAGLTIEITDPPTLPLQVIDPYGQKVIAARRRGAVYPYELIPLLTRAGDGDPATGSPATFVEYDLVDDVFGPVDRPAGLNTAAIVAGVVRTPTVRYPEGMVRVALLGDPTMDLGALAEPECRRIMAGLDLAEQLGAPVEWFAVSAGAKISMDSGTENMDWIGRVLRRIVTFTQQGGEINVVVAGINVGAQPYWNAEATMLMHTRGILVMTPDSAMVLTGKQALDYSGGVSAEDNFGIGGFDRVMGPNGQAQYWAPDLAAAAQILFSHYEHSYLAPGERFPRRAVTGDPHDRDVRIFTSPVDGVDFANVGEIFAEATNPGRKKPFDIRALMSAVADQDHSPLERWAVMRDAAAVVVHDTHLGGWPVTLIGIESRPMPRFGELPADGPSQWTAGTLFPRSSKKLARAINAASGTRPVVVLANLSGFDGSPESLRKVQLEYGAEIGRAVVNFDGPIVFCVVSRYHGGAFVVFSRTLNDDLYVAAVEGSHASVIGGAPAAAVVFSAEVNARVAGDERVASLEAESGGTEEEMAVLLAELEHVRALVRSEKLGEVADEFDQVHSIGRAQRVGSVNEIVPAGSLRPFLIGAVETGIARTLNRIESAATGEVRI